MHIPWSHVNSCTSTGMGLLEYECEATLTYIVLNNFALSFKGDEMLVTLQTHEI